MYKICEDCIMHGCFYDIDKDGNYIWLGEDCPVCPDNWKPCALELIENDFD